MPKQVIIVGAGLVGSLLACFLARRGCKVSVYERRGDMRVAGYEGGRSINLALSHRGWKALKAIGLEEPVQRIAIPMQGRAIHDANGGSAFIPYGQEHQAIYSVSRGELNRILVEEAERTQSIKFQFNERCTGIDFDKSKLVFENTLTGVREEASAEIIFGADGAYSEVRYQMQKMPNFNITQQHEEYGYKELQIPPGKNGEHLLAKNALHIWPRGGFMLIALPNLDCSFTVTLFAPFKGPNSLETIQTDKDIIAYFERNFPDALKLMPGLVDDFRANPTSSLVTIRCFPWKYKNTCLIGDAAHAVVPFYGQGMNCGFEDVRELDELFTGENWDETLKLFQHQRKPNADAIADLALHNYIEMRDLSGREDFQLRLKIEKRIAEKFPSQFMTHYSMVTFSDLSYSEAKKRGDEQNELLDSLMATEGIERNWDGDEVLSIAQRWLNRRRTG